MHWEICAWRNSLVTLGKINLPMEYFNIQVASTWHIPGQYVSICGNTMRDCTIQLCLVKTSRVRHIIIQQMHEYHSQAGAFHLVLQALGRRFVNLREMGQSKSCLICPIICCVHAVIIECTVAAPVHVHSSFHSYLNKWWSRGVNTLLSETLQLGGGDKNSVDLHNLYALSLHAARAFDHAHLFLLF